MCSQTHEVVFEYKMIHPDAKPPMRKRDTDAGYDLSSVADIEIQWNEFASVPTGLQISAPPGYYYVTKGRSGMLRDGIIVAEAVIDSTYTGEIFIIIHNRSDFSYKINVGDRIAQLMPHKIRHVDFKTVDAFSPQYNVRGEAGWGSSGR